MNLVVVHRVWCGVCFFFQAEDGIRDLVRSRGLGDVYKRQLNRPESLNALNLAMIDELRALSARAAFDPEVRVVCLLYTSDAADERSSVDLGGRRIIKKKIRRDMTAGGRTIQQQRNRCNI